MIDNEMRRKRANELLYLEQNVVSIIHQEIIETLRGKPSDITERLKYVIDNSNLAYSEKSKERDTT